MFRLHADLFKVLSVDTRLKILDLLKLQGPLCVNDLADALDISASAVSQHLKVLKQAGLVRDERQGYFVPYDINITALEDCGKVLIKVCSCDCCGDEKSKDTSEVGEPDRLKLLSEYENELKRELDRVKERIEELKKQ